MRHGARLLLGILLWASACADQRIMPENVRVSSQRLGEAFDAGDYQHACAVIPLVAAAIDAWQREEAESFQMPLVGERRAGALRLEGQKLAEWAQSCRAHGPPALGLGVTWKKSWATSAATLEILGRVPGPQRTARWLLLLGAATVVALLLGFAIAFRLRGEGGSLRERDDDER